MLWDLKKGDGWEAIPRKGWTNRYQCRGASSLFYFVVYRILNSLRTSETLVGCLSCCNGGLGGKLTVSCLPLSALLEESSLGGRPRCQRHTGLGCGPSNVLARLLAYRHQSAQSWQWPGCEACGPSCSLLGLRVRGIELPHTSCYHSDTTYAVETPV